MKAIYEIFTDLKFLKEQRMIGRFAISDKHESDDLSTIINRNIKKLEKILSNEREGLGKHEQNKKLYSKIFTKPLTPDESYNKDDNDK